MATREPFFRLYVELLQVAVGCLPLFLPLRDASLCGLPQERLGRFYKAVARVQTAVRGLEVVEAMSRVHKMFGMTVLTVNAVVYFSKAMPAGLASDTRIPTTFKTNRETNIPMAKLRNPST